MWLGVNIAVATIPYPRCIMIRTSNWLIVPLGETNWAAIRANGYWLCYVIVYGLPPTERMETVDILYPTK